MHKLKSTIKPVTKCPLYSDMNTVTHHLPDKTSCEPATENKSSSQTYFPSDIGLCSQAGGASAVLSGVELCWPQLEVWMGDKSAAESADSCRASYHPLLLWMKVHGGPVKPRPVLSTHALYHIDGKDPCIHILDGWVLATKTHPICTISEDGTWLPKR